MKGTVPVLVALAMLAASPLASAQGAKRTESPGTQFRFQTSPTSSFLLNRSLFSPPLAGSGSRPSNDVLPFSNHPFRSPGFFSWSQSRWTQGQRFNVSPLQPYPFFSAYGEYGDYGGPTDSQNNGLRSFIEQWGNQDPFAPKLGSSLSGSPLLSPGMTEEEVTRLVGSPIEKISSGEVQIWKYSSFSLRFENDKLKGLQ
jgi:hypothetical protein